MNWVERQVDLYRNSRRRAGHEPDQLGEGLVVAAALSSPNNHANNQRDFESVLGAIERDGRWHDHEEWRICTAFESSIDALHDGVKKAYLVAVECDGQRMSAKCPTLEKAYSVMRTYQQIIVAQFYSVGPPWMENGSI